MTATARYVNPRTGASWSTDEPMWRAPDDGDYVNLDLGPGISPGQIDTAESSLWRYRAAIRLPGPPAATLGEGWTPMLPGKWDGMPVRLKADFLMPTGSFKDRGTAVMMNYLVAAGVADVMEDSSGNAGASVAAYAAALGMKCRIFVPAAAPRPKQIQIGASGATVVPVPGDREAVTEAAMAETDSAFYATHNRQPHFLEGTKTLAFEIWEQMGFKVPDAVVAPLGQGSNIMGSDIGFRELLACGAIDRMPRIYGIQAANAAPYHAAWAAGSDTPVPIQSKPTAADGIASTKPVRLREVLSALRGSGGASVAVDEEEIAAALGKLCSAGWFVEPTCAAVGAGLSRLIADGSIRRDESVCLVLTGTGLKSVDKIGEMLGL